jgi:hypothetical protein
VRESFPGSSLPDPSGCGGPRRPFGVRPRRSPRRTYGACGLRAARVVVTADVLTSSRVTDRTTLPSERTEGGSWWKTSRELSAPRGAVYSDGLKCPGAPGRSIFGSGSRKRTRVRGGKLLLRSFGKSSGEAQSKPMRAAAASELRPWRGTVSCGEQSPGVAGHLDLLVLRAEG